MTRWDATSSVGYIALLLSGWSLAATWQHDRAEQWRQVRAIVKSDPMLELAPGSPAEYAERQRVWVRGEADAALEEFRAGGGSDAHARYMSAARRAYLLEHWKPHMSDSELRELEAAAVKDAVDRFKR